MDHGTPKHGVAEWILDDLHVPVCALEVRSTVDGNMVPMVDSNRQAAAVRYSILSFLCSLLQLLLCTAYSPKSSCPQRLNTVMPAINGPFFVLNAPFVRMESTVEHRPGQTEILLFSSRSFSAS